MALAANFATSTVWDMAIAEQDSSHSGKETERQRDGEKERPITLLLSFFLYLRLTASFRTLSSLCVMRGAERRTIAKHPVYALTAKFLHSTLGPLRRSMPGRCSRAPRIHLRRRKSR